MFELSSFFINKTRNQISLLVYVEPDFDQLNHMTKSILLTPASLSKYSLRVFESHCLLPRRRIPTSKDSGHLLSFQCVYIQEHKNIKYKIFSQLQTYQIFNS